MTMTIGLRQETMGGVGMMSYRGLKNLRAMNNSVKIPYMEIRGH